MKPYPNIQDDKNPTMKAAFDYIARERQNDITNWNSLPNTYIAGRKVAKIPVSSADITGNFPGDVNFTNTTVYFCVESGGNSMWVKAALVSF